MSKRVFLHNRYEGCLWYGLYIDEELMKLIQVDGMRISRIGLTATQ